MKKDLIFPLLALGGGGAAFVLRLLQLRHGFEPDTGLPIPGDPLGLALAVLLILAAIASLVLVRTLPEAEEVPPFPESFAVSSPGLLALGVTGAFLMALSGLTDLAFGLLGSAGSSGMALTAGGLTSVAVLWTGTLTPRMSMLQGAVTLAAAAGLFCILPACRQRPGRTPRPVRGELLLVSVVCLVVRLVLVSRACSIDPTLAHYYVELLALVLTILAVYRLSAFAFRQGRTRRFVLYAVPAILLCVAALADSGTLPALLFHGGSVLFLLGLLLQHLAALRRS